MARVSKILRAVFFGITCALTLMACSHADSKPLPTIKADIKHQIEYGKKNNLSYEVPSGDGFLIDTSEFKKEYVEPSKLTFAVEVSKIIRLDAVRPHRITPFSITLLPGKDLYRICPSGGLRSGDKFTIQIAQEVTDWGHYNIYPSWTAYVTVR